MATSITTFTKEDFTQVLDRAFDPSTINIVHRLMKSKSYVPLKKVLKKALMDSHTITELGVQPADVNRIVNCICTTIEVSAKYEVDVNLFDFLPEGTDECCRQRIIDDTSDGIRLLVGIGKIIFGIGNSVPAK